MKNLMMGSYMHVKTSIAILLYVSFIAGAAERG
jgi:hypothetical protein